MTIGTVQKYSYINAKLRGKIGNLLNNDFFVRMENGKSVPEVLELLKTTPYKSLNTIYDKTGDLKSCELGLLKTEIEDIIRILPFFGKREQPFLEALLMGFEIDNIKNAFRLWFDHIIRGRDITMRISYFYRDTILYDIDYEAIINTREAKDILPFFEDTPFFDLIETTISDVIDTKTLFNLEIALDILYFDNLIHWAHKLNRSDTGTALSFIKAEIDHENILGALRVKNYYNIDRECFIPGGEIVTHEIFTLLKNGSDEQMFKALDQCLGSASPLPGTDPMKTIQIISETHQERQLRYAHRTLGSNPFTIGTLLAYTLLKRAEIDTVRHLLNSKYYGK